MSVDLYFISTAELDEARRRHVQRAIYPDCLVCHGVQWPCSIAKMVFTIDDLIARLLPPLPILEAKT